MKYKPLRSVAIFFWPIFTGQGGAMAAADPGGGQGGHAPPVPVKTSRKKDGCHRQPLIFHISCPPLTILDPMLHGPLGPPLGPLLF